MDLDFALINISYDTTLTVSSTNKTALTLFNRIRLHPRGTPYHKHCEQLPTFLRQSTYTKLKNAVQQLGLSVFERISLQCCWEGKTYERNSRDKIDNKIFVSLQVGLSMSEQLGQSLRLDLCMNAHFLLPTPSHSSTSSSSSSSSSPWLFSAEISLASSSHDFASSLAFTALAYVIRTIRCSYQWEIV